MKLKSTLLAANISLLLLVALSSAPVSAQNPDPMNPSLIPADNLIPECDFATGQLTAACAPAYLKYLIRLAFMFIGAFFLLMIIIAGYQFAVGSITGGAGGKEAGMKKLQWAIIGFMVCALAFFIIDFFISALAGW